MRARRCKCGWAMKASPAFADANFGCCEWIGDGRCHYAGSVSTSTNGKGPWYCTAHSGCDDPALGAQIVEESKIKVPNPDYGFDARKRYFLERGDRPARRSNSPIVQAIRDAYQERMK
jgi:hypothetical protein